MLLVAEAPLEQFDSGGQVRRGPWMTYHFPQMRLSPGLSSLAGSTYDAGRNWSVSVSDPECTDQEACVWLGLDDVHEGYVVLRKVGALCRCAERASMVLLDSPLPAALKTAL